MSGTERGVDDMIIEHYASFRAKLKSSALNQENWDILRTESTDMAYAIEDNIEQYERNCMEAKTYELSAEKIVELLSRYNCKHIVGLGSGKGILEWHIKRCMPQMYVECTDYARASMEKLEKVFTKCDGFHCFDMLHGDYTVFGQDVCFVLYRVSEEFSYEDWCRVFGKMRAEGVRNIIYIPDMLATEELAEKMAQIHARHIEKGRESIFCGWIYSEDTLEEMFAAGQYKIVEKDPVGELTMYYLQAD